MVDESRERVHNYQGRALRYAGLGGPAQQGNEVSQAGACVVRKGFELTGNRLGITIDIRADDSP